MDKSRTSPQTLASPANASFLRALRHALRYLYVPAELRKSPLFALFGIDHEEGPAALRPILVDAIQALRPGPAVPLRTRPWRAYNTLLYLYVQQFSQEEVAAALSISSRQLRRQEWQALQLLADHLWMRYNLKDKSGSLGLLSNDYSSSEDEAAGRRQELEWLERSVPTEVADMAEMVNVALKTVAPLAERLNVQVESHILPDLPRLAAQLATLQQALVMILTAMICSVPEGRIGLEAKVQGSVMQLMVQSEGLHAYTKALTGSVIEDLKMAQQLVALSDGSLEHTTGEPEGHSATIRLTLPIAEQVAVLIIDDNADTLQLFQRYMAGSRYPFIGARDPQQALALAQELRPRIIVLDVMLAGVDGWQLLAHLREHPHTRDASIIVCSILPGKQLALALGAATFLRKPVSREAFLAALDREASQLQREIG